MIDVIHLLPDSVANQIAAGEVIQRPASVIKELVENAVDAGATDINVIVKDAGKTLIQVVDNGCGMSPTDARMAFERHATSKIKSADDLFTLCTMGFRGEALPSICAISEVELRTRREGDTIGTRLVIEGSRVTVQEPCVCDKGTVIMVKKIFFNVPARRKFLKSDNVELANIMREFERLALVNNRLHLTIDTGSKVMDLRNASLRQRIDDLWKHNIGQQLLPVDVDTQLVKIEGFVTRPEFARRRNALQYLIVNGRNMRHPYFHKAIVSCFDSLIAADTQPCYFIKLTVDPDTIDVNIHPTKNEIKFEYEQQIWPILSAAVKASLGKFSAVPSIDFSEDALPVIPVPTGDEIPMPTLDIPADYNPFRLEPQQSGGRGPSSSWRPTKIESDWDRLYNDFISDKGSGRLGQPTVDVTPEPEPEAPALPEMDNVLDIAPLCMQYGLKYIVTSSREGLLIIDQHRAHVRILYEQYVRNLTNSEMVSQTLMFPETVQLEPRQQIVLDTMGAELQSLGLTVEYEEGNLWKITGIPVMLKNVDPKEVLVRILESADDNSADYGETPVDREAMFRKMALAMARSAAMKGGRKLTVSEMEHLTGELFALPDPAYTPDGNPIYCILDERRIESLFRR